METGDSVSSGGGLSKFENIFLKSVLKAVKQLYSNGATVWPKESRQKREDRKNLRKIRMPYRRHPHANDIMACVKNQRSQCIVAPINLSLRSKSFPIKHFLKKLLLHYARVVPGQPSRTLEFPLESPWEQSSDPIAVLVGDRDTTRTSSQL